MATSSPATPATVGRRGYLDWLRGVAVIIMIGAHTLDAWTRSADKHGPVYEWTVIVAGFGAPIFLFLAGIALALAAGGRLRKGEPDAVVAAKARRRGWQILGLAFLFRLQSWLISGGPFSSLLKVDILNVMAVAMLAAAVLWGWGRSRTSRTVALIAATVAFAMLTPIVREMAMLNPLPDRLEAYFRSPPNRTTFTLFPWAGFLLAGAAIGIWIDAARTTARELRLNLVLVGLGAALAVAGYAASFLPTIYERSSFWTSSPTFFFLRVGVLILSLPLAYAWSQGWSWVWTRRRRPDPAASIAGSAVPLSAPYSPLQDLGRASLFIYWIHVEMVYGVPTAALRGLLPFPRAVLAFLAFTLFLFAVAKAKDALVGSSGGLGWVGRPARR